MILNSFNALILAGLFAASAGAAELRVAIKGVRSESGQILIGLYAKADGFVNAIDNATTSGFMADSGRLIGTSIRAQAGTQSTVFTQLPPGRYAAIVIHDENDNGRLDKNALGSPTEGYGFGNDARGFFSAPPFDAAAVTIGEADLSTSIALIYPQEPWAHDNLEYD